MNVLIYDDLGASTNSVKHTYNTLENLLGHAYNVKTIDRKVLQSESWEADCTMLVIPGGRDLPYCEALNGKPNARIDKYVRNGGLYLGICAGAYYASKNIEFEKGNSLMEIIQPRELEFYPGLSRGTVFPGFVYNSENGARSVAVITDKDALGFSKEIKMYYNGGGYFCHPEKYNTVTVLCRFKEHGSLCTDEPQGPAAAVHCKVDKGSALLIATHPEYDVLSEDILLANRANSKKVSNILKELVFSEVMRKHFFRMAFLRMGLKVLPIDDKSTKPEVVSLYLSGLTKELVHTTVSYLLQKSDQYSHLLKDKVDFFCINELDNPCSELVQALSLSRVKEGKSPVLEIVYPSTIYATEPVCPPSSMTPHFNIQKYYKYLSQEREKKRYIGAKSQMGNIFLYADVLFSTQELLYKNTELATCLPTGLVCLAKKQTFDKSSKSSISQAGVLQFSFIFKHSIRQKNAPTVFIRYIAAVAIIESIKKTPGCSDIPLRLKWPSSIYSECKNGELKKVGDVSVNLSFISEEFTVVIGFKLNLSNEPHVVSINNIIKDHDVSLKKLSGEYVLAGIMTHFEAYYNKFCINSMGPWFLDTYYEHWLHSGSVIKLEMQNNEKVKIASINPNHGMLQVESLDRPGKLYGFMPDGNILDIVNCILMQKK